MKKVALVVVLIVGVGVEATVTECDVLVARRVAESGGKAAVEATLWGCP